MPDDLHALLARQLRRERLGADVPPGAGAWARFLGRISASYGDIDRERYVYERSMRIASREMEEMAERITEASDRVAAERDRLAAILGSLGDGVIVVAVDGVVESANPEAHGLLGVPTGGLVGRGLGDAVHIAPVDKDPAWRGADLAALTDGGGYTGVVRVTAARGAPFVADMAVRGLGETGDADGACVVVLRDITDTWRTGRERAALERLSRAVAEGTPTARVGACVADELVALFGVRALVVPAGGQVGPGAPAWVDRLSTDRSLVNTTVSVDGEPWGDIVLDMPGADDARGEARQALARFGDLMALSVANDRARQSLVVLATTDALTGLHNTRAFRQRLAAEIDVAQRMSRPLSLAVLDIDHFKQVNDVHGHPAGDAVLVDMARRLGDAARAGDCVARIGGEEFAWLMPDTDVLSAMEAAERARGDVRDAPFPSVGMLTASFGVAAWREGAPADDLVERADAALYWAKRHGRDAVFPHTDELAALLAAVGAGSDGPPASPESLLEVVAGHAHDRAAHAARVGRLADTIAERVGWSPEDRRRLLQACLVHDLALTEPPVGDPRLTRARAAWAAAHRRAGLAAAAGVLDAEQTAWVRERDRRWDDSTEARADVPGGACILAAADAWDTLITPAPLGDGHAHERALELLSLEAGARLCPDLVRHVAASVAGVP
ncbi:MAG: diguanylate cyclase [Thermoleophilia bacterium]|nr:diguanylate cyclase [Thermoleophilia bacterium]